MILTIFEKILLGHLVGDYLLQTEKIALLKTKKGLNGNLWCILHCLIYTASICLFTQTINPILITLIFISHYPIDRWSLADKWLMVIRGRRMLVSYYKFKKGEIHSEFGLIYSCIVYTVVDNTVHLLLMISIFSWVIILK
jgi:hypothetical protein